MTSDNPVDKNEPGSDANRKSTQQSGHSKPNVPPAPPTPELPPTPTQHYQPDRRKDITPPWKKRGEIAAITIAFGLLVVNIFALLAAKKAADTAKNSAVAAKQAADTAANQLELSQRPWIKIVDVKTMG